MSPKRDRNIKAKCQSNSQCTYNQLAYEANISNARQILKMCEVWLHYHVSFKSHSIHIFHVTLTNDYLSIQFH